MMPRSAYVHIPFCTSICSYCAFARTASLDLQDPWLKQITCEIRDGLQRAAQNEPDFRLETVYFGGGTPSVLSDEQLATLAGCFAGYIDDETEWTMEINPESVNKKRLEFFASLGINRLSVGVQSFDDGSLKQMNRHHTAQQAIAVIDEARQAGFDNISADLIYALPWQSLSDLQKDLDCFLQLHLPHLSIYSLQIEENSVFGKSGLELADEDLEADGYELICRTLKAHGYRHYEISSFAKEGYPSRHNLAYWSDAFYFGFGYGAAGYDEGGFYHHEGSLHDYIQSGCRKVYDSDLDPAFTAIMMGLRTCYGLNIDAWQKRYQRSIHDFDSVLQAYCSELSIQNGYLQVNERGMEILNTILVDFLEAF